MQKFFNQSINQSTEKPDNQAIYRLINQSIDQSLEALTYGWEDQRGNPLKNPLQHE
jgi:hypothetical protein